MKHVAIVIPSGGVLAGIEVARNVFSEANDYLISQGQLPLFKIQLVGATKVVQLHDGMFTIQADITIQKLKKVDLIIIPALNIGLEGNLNKNNKDLITWLKKQHQNGAELASLCVGAFLLASTGLVNGKVCTTHWKASESFRKSFPDVKLVKEKIITDDDGIYSSGGGFSMLNLLLYLVEKFAGRGVAIYCAKYFQIDIERSAQLPFIIFQGQKDHSDEQIRQAQVFIENNYYKRITIDQLAEMLAVGRRTFERRFKKATANTLNEYIKRVKIEAAKKQLELGDKKINDIMYAVGYADTKTFRTSFKMVTGLLPNEYRSKYNKKAVDL